MGAWGPALFSSDNACDIRDSYRDLIETGYDDAEATRLIIEKYQKIFDDPEDAGISIVALSVTQSKIGRLDPMIRDRALAMLDAGADIAIWKEENPKLVAAAHRERYGCQ